MIDEYAERKGQRMSRIRERWPEFVEDVRKLWSPDKPKAQGSFAAPLLFGVGELVITRIKNRWGLECAGTIEAILGDKADVRVWNMNGPGADVLVMGIPITELTKDTNEK